MIYTVGYNSLTRQELLKEATIYNSVIVDIRYYPKSYNVFWNKNELMKYFGDKYVHIPKLGNKNVFNNKKIEIDDIEKGVFELLKYGNTILMCCCQEFDECHRKVISEYLFEHHGIETEEIES